MYNQLSDKNRILLTDILCFVLAAAGMYVILACTGYGIGGEYSLITGDLKENYIPAIRNICRSIRDGENIFYTWFYGIGSSTALYNAYYAYSPFNLIYFIFYNCNMNVVTAAVIMLKTGLATLFFRIFIRKAYGIYGISNIIMPVFYGLCSYQIVFNVHNIIWLDAMFVLPMIFLGINRLVHEGSFKGLFFWYAYIFISQFYMGYMIGAISFVYFVLCIWVNWEQIQKSRVVTVCSRYICAVAGSIAVSAFAWLPALIYIRNNYSGASSEFEALGINILDVYNQLFWGEVSGYNATFPYIYCGTLVLILVPLFFADKKYSTRERLAYGIMLLLMLVSCVVLPLYSAWHGFDFPNSYGFRFAFIISFVLCTIAARELDGESANHIWLLLICFANAVIYIGMMMWQSNRFDEYKLSGSWLYLGVNIILMAIWGSAVWIRSRSENDRQQLVAVVLVVLTMAECISNGYVMMNGRDPFGKKLNRTAYQLWDSNGDYLSGQLSQEMEMFRVCQYQDLGPSTGMNYGYGTVSYFGSSENIKLRNVLGYMGIWNSPRIVRSYGLTDATKMLLGVKYDFYGDKYTIDEQGNAGYKASLEKREDFLGIGYMVAGDYSDYFMVSTNAFENINYILSQMTGENILAFNRIDSGEIELIQNGLVLGTSQEGLGIYPDGTVDNIWDMKISFSIDNDKDNYAYIDNTASYFTANAYLLAGGDENYIDKNGAMTVSYIKPLEKDENGSCLNIVSNGYTGEGLFRDISFYYEDSDQITRAYEKLCQNVLEVEEYRNGYVRGKVAASDDRRLLFTSIPYEKGWKALVDGREVDITPTFYDTMIAIPMDGVGEHSVELVFEAPGLRAGITISVLSMLLMIVLIVVNNKNMK